MTSADAATASSGTGDASGAQPTPTAAPADPTRSYAGATRGTVVVTGAGRGLGRQIALALAAAGWTVAVTDADGSAADAVAAELVPTGAVAVAHELDVTDLAACERVAASVLESTGRLDVWVNNAGVLVTGPMWEQSPQQRELMIRVNALGTMNGMSAALDHMRAVGRGHIVNIASLAGLVYVPGEAVYAASKHAVIGLSHSTAADLRLAGLGGIRISCVCPDGIWTPMLHDKLEDPQAAMSFSGVLLQPERVAAVVARVVERPRAVTAVPGWRGAMARTFDLTPGVGRHVAPLIMRMGRLTQRRLAKRARAEQVHQPVTR